ncbi:hypothetical protein CSV79_16325 [Sporosarcina sp. P13]|uniref:hypothetical protein n=1 Tax=Sporosarcina sp. P13 TaxID=2048263 RepID=UPI000C16890E|nr:hypothetical protein [Sporosarcina sp. P13]PIC62574.1 hypothetical protein CSV79_16325 [Sporosarcina sp. P13]
MRKYTLLIMGIGLILVTIWFNYDIYQPKVGPIGNKLPTYKDYLPITITNLTLATFAIIIFISLFLKEKTEKKNPNLRVVWIVPNVFIYLMFIGALIFVTINAKGIQENGMILLWIFTLFVLFVGSVLGSFHIRYWIKQGKM